MTEPWDHEFTVSGLNWGLRILENKKVHLAQIAAPAVKGQTGVLWKAPIASLVLPAEIFTKVAEYLERIKLDSSFEQEKDRAEKIFTEAVAKEIEIQSDLRYGVREPSLPVVTPLTLEHLSVCRDCPITALRTVVQDYVLKGVLGIDAYRRVVVYQPEHFYEGWAY